MKSTTHSQLQQFEAKLLPSELVRKLNASAQREGISFAEAVRRAIQGSGETPGDIHSMNMKQLLEALNRAA